MGTTLVTSDEINYLIYRYLQESGFQHTAFTFGMEASIAKATVNTANVPPGALVSFLQKGLQLTELEQQVDAVRAKMPPPQHTPPSTHTHTHTTSLLVASRRGESLHNISPLLPPTPPLPPCDRALGS
ncbi:hypothetical protein T492DRAFT_624653 [Pavlovales sp. CCMP2436]|nr:hypothetical protein T492DRAFT_624653 [Pavlovales sp. CCMP2436]